MEERELVIIGGGPAGLTAAIYGIRAGLNLVLLEKSLAFGGQITVTNDVENWPGTKKTTGTDLGNAFHDHAKSLGVEFKNAAVRSIEMGDKTHIVKTSEGDIKAQGVIIATGAEFRRLGCKGEAELIGKGVSFCATCDAPFFVDEKVAVIGGGNTAVEEALYLTRFASEVFVVHRRDQFRADKLISDRALANEKITPVWDSVVESINGDDLVEGMTVKNVKTGELTDLDVAGVFVFVGTVPMLGFLKEDQLEREWGWIKADMRMQTSVPGIYAAGDVRNTPLRQVVTAASDGALAAMAAYDHITGGAYGGK